MDCWQVRRGNCKHVIHRVILGKMYGNKHYQHGRNQFGEVVVCARTAARRRDRHSQWPRCVPQQVQHPLPWSDRCDVERCVASAYKVVCTAFTARPWKPIMYSRTGCAAVWPCMSQAVISTLPTVSAAQSDIGKPEPRRLIHRPTATATRIPPKL
jgi:hypothetical protein